MSSWDEGARDRIESIDFYRLEYLSDGLKVRGFVLAPQNANNLPAVIYNRGGNGDFGAISDTDLVYWVSRFAAMGYVVYATQYRGNDGGEGVDTFGGDDVNDVLNLIPIIDADPRIDSSKIFMYGHSRGGLMSYLALTHTDRIAALVVDAGVADSIDWIAQRPEIEEVFAERVPNFDTEREEALLARSPTRFVERMASTPILCSTAMPTERSPTCRPRRCSQLSTHADMRLTSTSTRTAVTA